MDGYTPEGKRFMQELEKLNHLQVKVGFQAGETCDEETGTDMVLIAAYNELGTADIPARPFMRESTRNNEQEIKAHATRAAKSIVAGGTADSVLSSVGAFMTNVVQKGIVDGEWVPNAPSTVRAKKSDKPLIDTGRMRQSVHFKVEQKGRGK